MAGIGRGRTTWSTRQAVERCVSLSLPEMLRNGQLTERASVQYVAGFTLRFIPEGARITVRVVELGQTIWLESTPANLGGIRWWFICPRCGERRAHLYLSVLREFFSCRECLNLTYRSRQEHRAYDRLYEEIAGRLTAKGQPTTPEEVEQAHREAKRSQRRRWLRKRERPEVGKQAADDSFLKRTLLGMG